MIMKRKITALCLVVALLAVAIVGGTMAYFTDTESATNVFTVGSIDIELTEPNWNPNVKPDIVPGNSYAKDPKLTNKGNSDAYVRIGVNVNNPAILTTLSSTSEYRPALEKIVDIQSDWTFDKVITNADESVTIYYNYVNVLAPDATTPDLFTRVMIPTDLKQTDEVKAIAGKEFKLTINGQAIQADGFATKEAAYAALDSELAIAGVTPSQPSTNDEFENALTQNNETIVVNLTADVTYDVAALANDAMGGTATKNIIINGNGYQITFNHTNGDWNNIVTNNGAKLTINNAKLTNSGYNDGPWNRHDLNCACEVVLNDVVSDKAMAFMAGATLNNVTIDDPNTSDTYAIWIQPNGQTVTLNGCTIDMLDCTDGRGIKIDEQYVSASQKVTLNVINTTFKTEEKAAIVVKSVAGAEININNVNIDGVAADSTNAVWVDEASAAYANFVSVTGASVIVEPEIVTTAAELAEALADTTVSTIYLGRDIDMSAANWAPVDTNRNLVINGNGKTISNMTVTTNTTGGGFTNYALIGYTGKDVTISNLTIDGANVTGNGNDNSTAAAFIACPAGSITLNNCALTNSKISNADYTAGLLGYLGSNNANTTVINITKCTVDNCTIDSIGNAAALLAMNNSVKAINIDGCVVTNNDIKTVESEQIKGKAGILISTLNGSDVVAAVTNTTTSANKLNGSTESQYLIGRTFNNNVMTVDGTPVTPNVANN